MRILFLLLLLIQTTIASHAATPDSTLFNSGFEKDVFTALMESRPVDSIDLFIALSYTSSSKDKVYRFTDALRPKISQYPMAKRLKTLYKTVHDEFLSKYNEESNFNDIFLNGNYNCLTASALYAIVLDRLGIKFAIKVTPTHVYIIADPLNTGYLIETTLPGEKIVQFDERFKKNYIEYLHNNKIISDMEFRSSTIDALFEKNYAKDISVSIKELAGLHYNNFGVYKHNKAEYAAALVNFEKAEMLYPDKLIKFLKSNALLNLLNEEHNRKKYNGITLAKYILSNDSSSEEVTYSKEYFESVSAELVLNHPDIQAYSAYFNALKPALNPQTSSEILRIYYFFRGYYDVVNYDYGKGLAHLAKAYQYNPQNINTRNLILEAVGKHIVTDRNHRAGIDSLNAYFTKFPFLTNNQTLMSYMEYCYMQSIDSYFTSGDAENGYKLLNDIESFMESHPEFEPNDEYTAVIYQKIGFYYLSRSMYDKAEQVLRKGIRLVPDDAFLKGYLRSVMHAKGGNYEFPELMDDSKPMKTYLLAIAIAKDHAAATNKNTGYLKQRWMVKKVIEAGVERPVPEDETMAIHLMDNAIAEYVLVNEKTSGKWSYNNARCIIDLIPDEKGDPIHLIITELSSKHIKGVIYSGSQYEDAFGIVMIAE